MIGWFVATLLLTGCKGEPEEGEPLAVISADSLTFGEVPVGNAGEQTFTVRNDGGGTLDVLSITLSSGDVEIFGVSAPGARDLAAGAALDVVITFEPEEEAEYLGEVQVRTSDPENENLFVALAGTGTPSVLDEDADGYSPADGDCDDGRAETYPGADEICDGRDNDCDGATPDDETDGDGDGVRLCQDDCDDTDDQVFPGAPEICDDKDSDCDGVSSDRVDQDGDAQTICDGDCDDSTPAVYFGAEESCDDLDNDCSGVADDLDRDGDGHSPCSPGGDCDDWQATAYPVVVDQSYTGTEELGTDAAPFRTVAAAMAALDAICREIYVAPGDYEASLTFAEARDWALRGAGADQTILRAAAGSRVLEISGGADLYVELLTLTGGDASGDGGAIRITGYSFLTLLDATLTGNHATGDGGAIAAVSSLVDLERCTLSDNVADDDGGAVALLSTEYSDIDSTYRNNSAVRGGAVLVESSGLRVTDNTFEDNVASDRGGAFQLVSTQRIEIERNRFHGNAAVNGGGAIAADDVDSDDSVIRNNILQDNDGGSVGGGVAFGGSVAAVRFENNTLVANTSTDEGACVYVDASDASSLTIVSNIAGWCDGRSGIEVPATSLATVGYNTVYATSSGNDWSGGLEGVLENDVANPEFVAFTDDKDPTNDDLTLQASSPCIDSGVPTPDYNDTDGTQNDRGYTGGPSAP